MGAHLTRIISDVHFADRGSRVRALSQLGPLLEGVDSFVLNGDTLDTRPTKNGQPPAEARQEVLGFFRGAAPSVTFLTGNHDPDISTEHSLEFAAGGILVTHGDVLFDSMVPWSKDAAMIKQRVVAALAMIPDEASGRLESRLAAFRRVAATVPQHHQSERNPLRYAVRLAGDTVWPPRRFLSMLTAWREAPERAAALARRHRPEARFIIIGHTHKPGVWNTATGVVVVNTGSFCRPFGAMVADITEGSIQVRNVESKRGAFHPGREVARFPLP